MDDDDGNSNGDGDGHYDDGDDNCTTSDSFL